MYDCTAAYPPQSYRNTNAFYMVEILVGRLNERLKNTHMRRTIDIVSGSVAVAGKNLKMIEKNAVTLLIYYSFQFIFANYLLFFFWQNFFIFEVFII